MEIELSEQDVSEIAGLFSRAVFGQELGDTATLDEATTVTYELRFTPIEPPQEGQQRKLYLLILCAGMTNVGCTKEAFNAVIAEIAVLLHAKSGVSMRLAALADIKEHVEFQEKKEKKTYFVLPGNGKEVV